MPFDDQLIAAWLQVLKTSMNSVGPIAGQLIGGRVIERGRFLGRSRGRALYLLAAVLAAAVVLAHLCTSAVLLLCGRRALLTPRKAEPHPNAEPRAGARLQTIVLDVEPLKAVAPPEEGETR